jgi:FAD/FMN-containing dehydrogenase
MGMDLIESLKAIVGAAHVLTDETAMAGYLVDWSNRFPGKALAVVRPSTTEEVAAVLRLANETATPVVPQSGNTSLVAGATPDVTGRSIVLSMTRMNTIEQIDVINDTITVQAGVILAKAQEAAKEAGRFFPLSFGAQGSACLGGCLGTNAGGTGVLRYGNTRDLVLGLEAVLPDGRIVNMLRGLRKDNTGYDLKQLFVGSEGTLGVITRATLKLFPLPQTTYTALVGVADVQAAWWCLVELTFATDPGANPLEGILEKAFEERIVVDALLSNSEQDSLDFWAVRESITSADAHVGGNLHNDISDMADFVEEALNELKRRFDWIDPSIFGHLGDGNLHFNIGSIPSNLAFEHDDEIRDIICRAVARHNGSISAEHGIGQIKRKHFLALKNPTELAVMMAVKKALDPNGIMNPGKLLPD